MAARVAEIRVDPHTRHLDDECPACGWEDLWETKLLLLRPAAVTTLAHVIACVRCGFRTRCAEG